MYMFKWMIMVKTLSKPLQNRITHLPIKEDGECDNAERTYTEVEGEEGIRVRKRKRMRAVRE
jgi:hypothetical protein